MHHQLQTSQLTRMWRKEEEEEREEEERKEQREEAEARLSPNPAFHEEKKGAAES